MLEAGTAPRPKTHSGSSPTSRVMSADQHLELLEADDIENPRVVCHDYSGRSCAKTAPGERIDAVAD